ncbi:SH3 domain-containing protein, partial [Fischerella thermalis]
MFKCFLGSALILAAALPVKAEIGPGLGRTDIASSTDDVPYVCTNDDNGRLSLRSGPGTNFRKIKEIPNGNSVNILSGQYGRDRYYWWNVRHERSLGWVRADYVC